MIKTKESTMPVKADMVSVAGEIEGYASVFGNVDAALEVVEPGAFTASLASIKKRGASIKMLWQHDRREPIGVWDSFEQDSRGLYVKGRLLINEVERATEVHALLKAGALDGLSIGYLEIDVRPSLTQPGVTCLKKIDLKEVSVVTFAANELARVEMVKHALGGGALPTIREFEEALRELGFSRSKAAAIATTATPHLRGEPGAKATDELARFAAALFD